MIIVIVYFYQTSHVDPARRSLLRQRVPVLDAHLSRIDVYAPNAARTVNDARQDMPCRSGLVQLSSTQFIATNHETSIYLVSQSYLYNLVHVTLLPTVVQFLYQYFKNVPPNYRIFFSINEKLIFFFIYCHKFSQFLFFVL